MERIDKTIEILQAFKERKTIESMYYEGSIDYVVLTTFDQIMMALYKNKPIRIKKEPTYRPYANGEEFTKDDIKHGGWLKKKGFENRFFKAVDVSKTTVYSFTDTDSSTELLGVFLSKNSQSTFVDFDKLSKEFVWVDDGTPCGIKEE